MNRPLIVYADGPSAARLSPTDVMDAADIDGQDGADVTLGWTTDRHAWLDDTACRISTVLAGYGLSAGVAAGLITALPVRLSAVPSRLRSRPPDVGVIAAVSRGDDFAFRGSVGWGDVLAGVAGRIVLEVDEHAVDLGAPLIDGNIVATLPRAVGTSLPLPSRSADDTDLAIGARVASLLPTDPTLQFGPGGIGEGITRALTRPVRIWSGLCTDAMAELHERDLLIAPVVAAYTSDGAPVHRLAAAGMLELVSSTVTHDITRLSSIPRFVGCNTALQVGLDGSVNVERVGGRVIAAVGGHADFCAGASRSVGGLSIVAVRSTTAGGASTIVRRVDVVSTQRSDIDVVVTEHGVAVLRDIGDDERAARLIEIAAPEHRTALRA